jgi:hypothetical protein
MKGVGYSKHDHSFLVPWLIAAAGWCLLTIVLLGEYRRVGDPAYIEEFFFLLSLLWVEFGFAAMFNALYRGRLGRLKPFAAIALVPPLLLYVLFVM